MGRLLQFFFLCKKIEILIMETITFESEVSFCFERYMIYFQQYLCHSPRI